MDFGTFSCMSYTTVFRSIRKGNSHGKSSGSWTWYKFARSESAYFAHRNAVRVIRSNRPFGFGTEQMRTPSTIKSESFGIIRVTSYPFATNVLHSLRKIPMSNGGWTVVIWTILVFAKKVPPFF